MARLLQKSNQPSSSASSLGGLFTCCFANPRSSSPGPPVIPSIKVQGPLDYTSDIWKEREVADGNSVASKESVDSGSVFRKITTNHALEKSIDRNESMYDNLVEKDDEALVSINLSKIAGRKGGAQIPSGQATPATPTTSSSMHEFVEERYSKGFSWQSQGNLSVQESPSASTNTTVHTHVKLDYKSSDLIIQVKNVENAPGEETAGSQSYQVRLALVGLKKKKRWHSRIIPAPNPVFNEEAVFKGVTADELGKLAIRIRLYGCRKHRRHFIFAESIVAFTALNLRAGEADVLFALVSKVGHESVVDSDSDIGEESVGGSRFGSRLSIRSQASQRPSSRLHRSTSRHRRPPSASSGVLKTPYPDAVPELETARRVVENREANWPELLCGLAYNTTTKRLSISILRVNRLKVPEGSFRSPKVYVALTLVSEAGEEITSSHTHDVHLSANTEFGEKFAFDMNSLNPREVTLFVRVFQKRHLHKNESLGWFAIGAKNNGEEERSHWNEMLQAQGKEISRWHVLNENVS